MTGTAVMQISFGMFFSLFERLWHYHRNEDRCNGQEAFDIFNKLSELWNDNKWNLFELYWICDCMWNNNSLLDLAHFLFDEYAYLNHLKNCYYLYY